MPRSVTVAALLRVGRDSLGLRLELLAGEQGLDRRIESPHIQKTGLALAGFDVYLQPSRILVFGESEVRFLERLSPDARNAALEAVFGHDLPCVIIAGGWSPPSELTTVSARHGIPLLRTPVSAAMAITKLTAMLDDALAVREVIHGVLVDILGLGVLLVGESGIGKSECALDLIVRGHRLVADDTVEIRRLGETVVIGTCPELTRHHMEIRGLGIINVLDLFGVASTRISKRVELVVQLERWDAQQEYDRLGLDDNTHELFGLKVPLIRMPVGPGRNLAILVEVAARNQLLRARGLSAAQDLASRLERSMAAGADLSDGAGDGDGDESEQGDQV